MRNKSPFQIFMYLAAAVSLAVLALCLPLWDAGFFEALGITALTVFYHFAVRLFLGDLLLPRLIPEHPDWRRRRFRVGEKEQALYARLGVKRWKGAMPTYDPAEYTGSIEHILEATCRSELVHECCAAASFVPLLFSRWFGAFPVFLLTSLAGAALDLAFIAMQRCNRPRLARVLEKRAARRGARLDSRGCPGV